MHGLAHAGAGIWAAGRAPAWLVTPLWLVAMPGFIAAALAIFGLQRLRRYAEWLTLAATVASAALLRLAGVGAWSVIGLMLGLAFCGGVRWWARRTRPEIQTPTFTTGDRAAIPDVPRLGERVWAGIGYAVLGGTALLIALRPWHMSWGTTAAERATPIAGLSRARGMRYRADHAVTVRASASRVWPWVAQAGRGPAGRISYWDPPRVMVLNHSRAFIVEPIDSATSRVRIHTRSAGEPALRAVPLAPLDFYFLEPARFIMEREMLLGIKARSERQSSGPPHD